MKMLHSLQAFFFARESASGFGLMRIAWSAVALVFLLFQWSNVAFFYSSEGLMNPTIAHMLLRSQEHYTLLPFFTNPDDIFALYIILLIFLGSTIVGIFPRFTMVISLLLLFSFHEADTMVLGGGDTMLRNVGFILAISPGIEAFSVHRLREQYKKFRISKKFLSPVTMSSWPYRLLLWQMIVLYGTSFWYKLLGTMWLRGTAVQTALHHPIFSRWPMVVVNTLMPVAPALDWLSLGWEGLWVLLLAPKWLKDLLPPSLAHIPLKRCLIIGGILFHGSIFILMDAGSFSLAIFAAYFGLLRDEDIAWIAKDFPALMDLPKRTMRMLFKK